MILYGIILLLVAGLMTILAVRIYKGHTELIHNYHQTNVTDQVGYGKAMGKALMTLAGVMTVSGGVSFLGESPTKSLSVTPYKLASFARMYTSGIPAPDSHLEIDLSE